MESANGASSKGVLVPVPEASDVFQKSILAPLKSAYLYEESKQSFEYKSAFLLKNPELEEKYNDFRAKRRAAGYSEEDLKESYGFLLFDEVNKANTLGETGVLTGNSTCTTLGDPSKGIYISMYSDCLDLNRWYHGKSGYIAILKLTKGRVKKTLENYTQTFTVPTVGFDCHVSEQLPSVSDKTSSFLAFERTQYYMYELLDDGSSETSPSPSAACPYAIVSFSYTDTKATPVAPHQESEEKKLICHFFPWRGQLQIVDQFYDVRLRSTTGALIPAELPPVVKVDRAISMLDLRQRLPGAVFETCSLSGEVVLDGLCCSICEFVSSEVDETNSLSLLMCEVKENNIALPIPLKDGGFLILVHSSHFSSYDDTGSSGPEVLQGVFVFPDSRVIQKDTKCGHRNPTIPPEILRFLPVLSYAEGEVEKTPIDPSEELSEVMAQHMQNYAALVNPGLDLIPSREVGIFADQYDVPGAHKHLYASPEWTNRAWQSLQSYLSKPASFQIPVAKASEILVVGQENQVEDLDDDLYICLSSPEEVPTNAAGTGSEDQLSGQESCMNVGTSETSVEAPVDLRVYPQNVEADDLQVKGSDKDTEQSELRELIKTDMRTKSLLIPSASDELPAELIVSITSAEQTDESVISAESAKLNDLQISDFSTAKSQTTEVNTLNDDTVRAKKLLDAPEVNSLPKMKFIKVRRGPAKGRKKVSNTWIKTPSLPTEEMSVESDNSTSLKDNLAKESVDHQQSSKPTITDWRKARRRKRVFGKLSQRNKKVRSCTVGPSFAEEKKTDPVQQHLMELEAFPLRRKTERWDLKPVVSECGRILVPHGSVDITDKIKSLKDKLQSSTNEQEVEKMLVVASEESPDAIEMEQKASTAPETALAKIETTAFRNGGDHLKNDTVSPVSPKHSISRPLDAGNDSSNINLESAVLLSKSHDTSPLEVVQENPSHVVTTGKSQTKAEFLLSKLKSVLLRGKRKMGPLALENMTDCTAQAAEPCLKMSKVEPETGILKSNETDLGFKEVSKVLSVDPLFAYALGLTPKEIPKMVQKPESLDVQQSEDSSQTQEKTFEKQGQILIRPPSIFPRRGRIKTLKKHQDISAENVKKKWWLHFQTPACFARERHNDKECTRDNSVKKTVVEKLNSACSSTDALNLLADLALSASHDEVPPQPTQALGTQPETSLKKCDLTKDVTSVDQESVLHALLRQPAARPIQTLDSPSPSHLVECSELVGLVSKEHAYSLPPSSSLPLGLPGTPFQVSPLSGSSGLLQHQRTMYEDGSRAFNPSAIQKDKVEQVYRTQDDLKKHLMRRRKFRHSRTFVNMNESVQVTKQWKENYDFNLDSKFASDSKDGAIIRALHGPWDYSVQDSSEELRLIVHMWIGLFYSRSTPRLFHIDSDSTLPCSEESDSLEMSSELVSSSGQSELNANSDAHFPNVADTSDPLISKALDLSKKDSSALNQGITLDHGSMILDLSVKNSNAEVVTSDSQVTSNKDPDASSEWKGASKTLNTQSSKGQQEASPSKVFREIVLSEKIIKEVNDVRSTYKNNRTCTTLQKVGQLEHTNVSYVPRILEQKAMEDVTIQPEKDQTTSRIADMLQGCYNDKTDVKVDTGNSEATEIRLVQPLERVLSKSMMDDSNKEAGDGVLTFQPNEIEPKYGEELEVKGKLHQDDNHEPYPKRIQEGGDTTIKDLAVVCHENLMENEKRLSSEGPMAVSESKAVNVNEDVDCCAINESKVITEDHFGEDDRLVEKDSSVSAVDTESDEKNHPLSVMCNGQDFVKKNDITKHTCPEHLDEQLPQAENKESFHDLQLRKLCANGRDEHAIPQGCYNGKTDVKDDTGNSEATEIRLVQPLERVLSKSMMDDSNKEVGGGVPTFQPNEIEPKYGEELEVKGKLHQDDNHELYPKRIQEGGDTTIKDLAVVCHENLMENEKRLSSEGPMAVSESKAVNVNEDVDCCAINESKVIKEDHFGEDDRLVEKDSSVSAVDTESDEKNHPLSVMCNGQDFVKKDDITKHTCPEHLDEQLPQAENKQLFNDLQLRKLCANGRDKHAIPEKGPHSSSNMEAKCNEPAVKENAENDICTAAKATKNESTCSLDGSNARNCIPQTNNRVASGNKNKAMASFNLRSDDHKHWDTKSVQMVDNTTDKELSLHLSHSPKCEQIQLEAEVTKEMDQRSGKTNEGLEECNGRVVIPFIGIDISREDIVLPHDSQSQDCNCKKADVSTGKVSLLDIPENKPWAFGGWSDDRCPTPTMDEKPYESITSSDPQSYPSSTFLTQKCLNGSSVTGKDKVPIEQKPCQKSTVNGDSDPHHGLHPDLELRTLRVFQSIDQFLSKSELKIIHKKSAPVSSSSVQKVHTESSAHFLISPFKSKIEEVLGVGLQLKKTDSSVRQQYFEGTEKSQESSSGQGYCHPHHSLSSTSTLGAIISNVDQDTATSQANLSHEPCSSSLRPVMAVKPSKSDESQADSLSKDRQIDHSVMSKFAKNKQPKIPLVTSPTRTTMLLEKQRECYKGTSEGINNNAQEASKLLEKSSWSPHVGDRKSKYDEDTLVCQDPLYQNKRRDSSKYNKISSSSLPVQTFGCIKSSSQLVNGKHGFSTNSSADRVGQTAAESLDMDQNDCLSASTSLVDYKDDNNIDDSLYLGPDSSLSCTVYNTSQKRSHSFLEQISQRCIQEDPTEASMEQECLIFSEKIKQLLKRSKKGSIHQPESHGKLNLPCPSPMTVHFSGLEEQEETMDHLDAPSLFGQKIKVHMSDREDLEATTEGEKALHSKKSSEGTGTPIEDAGVSTVTAECAELYEEKMNNICAVRKVPSTRKHMERGCPRSEPSKYFDFCDQMKREMDNSFRSNLNSVVKKSRKTKYRFYILETSDDVFFEETKVQLEAEGHTAVQPSEFFLDKGTSSSLLIILRNEDIAEHICEVPHLLALKKSPGVQFAGIDETDDVVNLTHQELFTKGGFIMLDGAALEPLSLCDMKKMSEILQGLSKTGKWKWMLHYRDSRRLKENARLSQEAKEKKQLLNWCQEAGIIEVLPYHECDLMSRDQPDYLTCLVRLQVQNISARYTVFITDTATDSKFESNGIITTTFNSFLTCSPSEAFSA